MREAIRLRCAVVNVVDASSVDRRLPGVAARIECEEVPEPGGREAFSKEPRTIVFERSRYSHLYVVDLGWSIPVEGERNFTIDATPFKETWENALESFEGHS